MLHAYLALFCLNLLQACSTISLQYWPYCNASGDLPKFLPRITQLMLRWILPMHHWRSQSSWQTLYLETKILHNILSHSMDFFPRFRIGRMELDLSTLWSSSLIHSRLSANTHEGNSRFTPEVWISLLVYLRSWTTSKIGRRSSTRPLGPSLGWPVPHMRHSCDDVFIPPPPRFAINRLRLASLHEHPRSKLISKATCTVLFVATGLSVA